MREIFERSSRVATGADSAQREDSDDDGQPTPVLTLDDSAFAEAPRRSRSARLVGERRPILLLAAVAIMSAVVAAVVTWLGRPVAAPVSGAPAATMVVGDERAGNQPAGTAESGVVPAEVTAGEASEIVVSVVGMVAQPGLVTVPGGSRVSDAIDAAGGALPDADLTTVNLARKVADGEQIVVGIPTAASADVVPAEAGPAPKININQADEAMLDELPGIGPVIAKRIVAYRKENGPFATVDDLAAVSGIGPALLADLRDLVTV